MNNILTIKDIAAMLAARTGCSADVAGRYLEALFAEAAGELTAGSRRADIPGAGVLTSEGGVIAFTPDGSLAEAVNEPFSLFEAVEIASGVTAEELEQPIAEDAQPEPVTEPEPEPEPVQESEPDPDPEEEAEELVAAAEEEQPYQEEPYEEEPSYEETYEEPYEEEQPQYEEEQPQYEEEQPYEEPCEEAQPYQEEPSYQEEQPDYGYEYEEPARDRGMNRVLVFLLGLLAGIALSAIVAWLLWPSGDNAPTADVIADTVYTPEPAPIIDDEAAPAEPAAFATATEPAEPVVAPAQPVAAEPSSPAPAAPATTAADEPVYDTVRAGYFLTKMAKKHYGVEEFWVYIYDENKDRIKNPNQLPAGFKVVIPPAAKYGIDPNDPAVVERAKNRSYELNKQFRK